MKSVHQAHGAKRLLLILAIAIFSFLSVGLQAQVNQQDSLALVDLYNSTSGANWSNPWDLSEPVSTWAGVTISNERVVKLFVNNRGLQGTLPNSIGELSMLISLNIRENNILGAVPSTIVNLDNLLSFIANDNEIADLPDMGGMASLFTLAVEDNQLTFEDLESNTGIANFSYVPQAPVYNTMDLLIQPGADLTLESSIGGLNNEYQWKKDGAVLPGANGGSYQITNAAVDDIGIYTCEVTNTQVAGLTIQRNEIQINVVGGIPAVDSLALVDLYNTTNGPGWSRNENWLTGPIGSWEGLVIQLDSIKEVNLNANNLQGVLPSSLGELSKTVSINLSSNSGLQSSIPEEMGELNGLKILNLANTGLSGSIPSEIGEMASLQELVLRNCDFTGAIPPEVGDLDELLQLDLSFNELSVIPDQIGNMAKLEVLSLNNNNFSGDLSASILGLTTLENLSIANNEFENIPDFSSMPVLETLRIYGNRLSFDDILPTIGVPNIFQYAPQADVYQEIDTCILPASNYTIASEIGGVGNEYQWFLNGEVIPGANMNSYLIDNATTDDIGTYHCEVTHPMVPNLTIDRKPATICVATAVSVQDSLALVDLYNATNGSGWFSNQQWLTGPVRYWDGVVVELDQVTRIDLNNNNLQGSPNASLGELNALHTLDLSNNQLTGELPSAWNGMTNLVHLDVRQNELTALGQELGTGLFFLQFLDLSENSLDGAVPASFSSLISLEQLYVHNNSLDDFPDLMSQLDNLTLNLSNNQFTFEDVIPNVGGNFATIYAPQDSVLETASSIVVEGSSLELDAEVGGGVFNWYVWRRNGEVVQESANPIYLIENANNADEGIYTCTITNFLAPSLTLYRRPIAVSVELPTGSEKALQSEEVKVYPNPATALLFIQLPNEKKITKVTVFSVDGRFVKSIDVSHNVEPIIRVGVRSLERGTYLLHLQSVGASTITRFTKL